MSTGIRELFEQGVDDALPHDLGERALSTARARRRNRLVVGGAVAVAAAVGLGVAVGGGMLRSDVEPRPSDVAAIPSELPPASVDGVPNLEAGMMESASVAYVGGGMVVFVDAATGDVARRGFGPPDTGGGTLDVLVPVLDVALSPDGASAAVVVDGWGRGVRGPTLRVLDLASNAETLVSDVTPADDGGAMTLAGQQVVAWENDSSHFVCACSFREQIPRLIRVSTDGTWLFGEVEALSALQVTAGTAGVAAQLEANGGPWVSVSDLAPAIPASYTAALGRAAEPTYIALRGRGYTMGEVGGAETFSGPLPSTPVESQYVVATKVEAVVGGFVAVLAEAKAGEGFSDPADAIVSLEAVFIGTDGAYRDLVSLPKGTVAASFASDLVSG